MAQKFRNDLANDFVSDYLNLSDNKKNNFSRLCNKLLNDNFIYAAREDDRNDYYEVLSMKEMISNYFVLINFDLVHVDTYKIFYIKTSENRNRLHLKKLDTVILLILRLLYHRGSLNINSSADISLTFKDLIDQINQTGIFKAQPSFNEYLTSLRVLKRYKLINFNFKENNPEALILIYPTLLYVVKIDDIDMLNKRIKAYQNNDEEVEDETEEG